MKSLVYALCIAAALAGSSTFAANNNKAPNESVQNGVENIKEGTKEAAQGVEKAAEKASVEAGLVGKKMGRALKAATCPIVGDRKSKLYYAKDSRSYEQVLDGQKYFEDDDRACFMTEQAARDDGYTRSAN